MVAGKTTLLSFPVLVIMFREARQENLDGSKTDALVKVLEWAQSYNVIGKRQKTNARSILGRVCVLILKKTNSKLFLTLQFCCCCCWFLPAVAVL